MVYFSCDFPELQKIQNLTEKFLYEFFLGKFEQRKRIRNIYLKLKRLLFGDCFYLILTATQQKKMEANIGFSSIDEDMKKD